MREREREREKERERERERESCNPNEFQAFCFAREVYLGMHRTDTKLRAAQPRLYIIVNNG